MDTGRNWFVSSHLLRLRRFPTCLVLFLFLGEPFPFFAPSRVVFGIGSALFAILRKPISLLPSASERRTRVKWLGTRHRPLTSQSTPEIPAEQNLLLEYRYQEMRSASWRYRQIFVNGLFFFAQMGRWGKFLSLHSYPDSYDRFGNLIFSLEFQANQLRIRAVV